MPAPYKTIPIERVRELYAPDFDHGALVARVRINRSTPAGTTISASPNMRAKYQRVTIDGVRLYLHRVLWSMFHDRDPGTDGMVDHIDGDTKNNRISNLRLVNRSENAKNRRTLTATGIRGVYRRARAGGGQAFEVKIHRTETVDGVKVHRTHYFGTYQCPVKAKKAYLEAVDRFGDLEYLRDGQRGDGVEAIILEEIRNARS